MRTTKLLLDSHVGVPTHPWLIMPVVDVENMRCLACTKKMTCLSCPICREIYEEKHHAGYRRTDHAPNGFHGFLICTGVFFLAYLWCVSIISPNLHTNFSLASIFHSLIMGHGFDFLSPLQDLPLCLSVKLLL